MKTFRTLLLLLFLGTLLHSCGDEMGIVAGKVMFKGVPCQPGQPDYKVPPCSGPYPRYEIVIYHSSQPDTPVLTTMAGNDGTFSIDLPVGEYIIYTQNGPQKKHRQENRFKVKKDETTPLNLSVDIGLQ